MIASPATLFFALLAASGESPGATCTPGEAVPLDDSDLRSITLEVVQRYPLASSSPGIKFAAASCAMPLTEIADIVFYPHEESAGIKQAFQVQCRRELPRESWACEQARLRRYVRLESQAFEVRVVGNLEIDEVLALIQATRRTAPASAEAAIIVFAANDAYFVGWGSDDGQQEVGVEARLRKNGNPTVPEDWLTRIFEPPE